MTPRGRDTTNAASLAELIIKETAILQQQQQQQHPFPSKEDGGASAAAASSSVSLTATSLPFAFIAGDKARRELPDALAAARIGLEPTVAYRSAPIEGVGERALSFVMGNIGGGGGGNVAGAGAEDDGLVSGRSNHRWLVFFSPTGVDAVLPFVKHLLIPPAHLSNGANNHHDFSSMAAMSAEARGADTRGQRESAEARSPRRKCAVLKIAAIGGTTADAIRRHGVVPDAVAAKPSAVALAVAMATSDS